MALKLGEMLVNHQMITEAQLAEALRSQHIFGGRLGTNLVELGYLSEQTLVRFLSAQLKLPAVSVAELDGVKEEAIRAIPGTLADKYKVVPVSLKDRKLRLAMADATHLKAIDEVAFASGAKVEPLVAPELLITYALEKYYGIVRPTRYVRLTGTTSAEFQVVQTSHSAEELAMPAAQPSGTKVSVETRGDFLQHERSEFQQASYGLKNAAQDLAGASGSRDVFQILKKFVGQDFQRAAIFILRGEMIIGWHQVGCLIAEPEFRKVSFPIGDSVFMREVSTAGGAVVRSIPSAPIDDWLVSLLGLRNRQVLALPIAVNDQAVGILLASEPNRGELDDQRALYNTLATKLSFAIQMAYLRRRILD